jgi:hypothetical protein
MLRAKKAKKISGKGKKLGLRLFGPKKEQQKLKKKLVETIQRKMFTVIIGLRQTKMEKKFISTEIIMLQALTK